MSKKLVGLLLILATLLCLALTSCSSFDEDYESDSDSVTPVTLTLYGIRGEGTTDEAVKTVEAEINKYTEKNYKTTIQLKFFDENEYDDAIEDVYVKLQEQKDAAELAEEAASAAAKKAKDALKNLSDAELKEYKKAQRIYEKWSEENGVDYEEETSLAMGDNVSLDIFLIRGFDDYLEAVEAEELADLSSYANGTYSLINKYTSSIVLQAAKRNGMLYAVPSNKKLVTEDTEAYYYAFKTDILKKYGSEVVLGQTESLYDSLELGIDKNTRVKLDDFFAKVKESESCDVILAPFPAIQNFDFLLDDMNKYPAFGYYNPEFSSASASNLEFAFGVLNDDDPSKLTFNVFVKRMAEYRKLGYFASDDATVENTDFVLGIFKGTLDSVKAQLGDKADEYSYYIYKSSKATTENVFEYMLAVSEDCKYPDRAFQIICALHTVPELRNLITYGVEGVHYTVNEDIITKVVESVDDETGATVEKTVEEKVNKTVTKISNDYNIGFEVYGNSLIGYLPEGYDPEYQKNAAALNADVKVSGFLGYTLGLEEKDLLALEKVNEVMRPYIDDLMNGRVENVDELKEQLLIAMGKEKNVLGVYIDEKEIDFVAPNVLLYGTASMKTSEDEEGSSSFESKVYTIADQKNILKYYVSKLDDYTPAYLEIYSALNSDYSSFASNGRPADKQSAVSEEQQAINKREYEKQKALEEEQQESESSVDDSSDDGLAE